MSSESGEQDVQSVSVIGLGAMGAGIARTFLKSGRNVSVWNRSRAKVDALVAEGAHACDSAKDAIMANTHVVVCLTDYAAWKTIIDSEGLTDCFDCRCLIQLTTGTIEMVQAHEEFILKQGARLADGAVMCYPRDLGTETGSLLMAGSAAALEESAPLLSALAPTWTDLGDDVTRPTILSRALMVDVGLSLIGVVNGVALARSGGIPLDVFMEHSKNVGSIIPAEKVRLIEAIRDGNTTETQATINAWGEGQKAVRSVATSLGTNRVLQDAVDAVFTEAERLGLGQHDLAALTEVFSGGASDS